MGNDVRDSPNFDQLGYKLKLDITYDGNAPLREFLAQFELISLANKWDDFSKSVALATSLRGKTRSVLDGEVKLGNLSFSELKAKLEFRFGEGHLTRVYSQFTNRRQNDGENFVTLGAELEYLSRLVYPECSHESWDKIECNLCAIYFGVAKRFCKANTTVGGHNLTKNGYSKGDDRKSNIREQCLQDGRRTEGEI